MTERQTRLSVSECQSEFGLWYPAVSMSHLCARAFNYRYPVSVGTFRRTLNRHWPVGPTGTVGHAVVKFGQFKYSEGRGALLRPSMEIRWKTDPTESFILYIYIYKGIPLKYFSMCHDTKSRKVAIDTDSGLVGELGEISQSAATIPPTAIHPNSHT